MHCPAGYEHGEVDPSTQFDLVFRILDRWCPKPCLGDVGAPKRMLVLGVCRSFDGTSFAGPLRREINLSVQAYIKNVVKSDLHSLASGGSERKI